MGIETSIMWQNKQGNWNTNEIQWVGFRIMLVTESVARRNPTEKQYDMAYRSIEIKHVKQNWLDMTGLIKITKVNAWATGRKKTCTSTASSGWTRKTHLSKAQALKKKQSPGSQGLHYGHWTARDIYSIPILLYFYTVYIYIYIHITICLFVYVLIYAYLCRISELLTPELTRMRMLGPFANCFTSVPVKQLLTVRLAVASWQPCFSLVISLVLCSHSDWAFTSALVRSTLSSCFAWTWTKKKAATSVRTKVPNMDFPEPHESSWLVFDLVYEPGQFWQVAARLCFQDMVSKYLTTPGSEADSHKGFFCRCFPQPPKKYEPNFTNLQKLGHVES